MTWNARNRLALFSSSSGGSADASAATGLPDGGGADSEPPLDG